MVLEASGCRWGCGGARPCLNGVAQWLLRHKGLVVAAAVVAVTIKVTKIMKMNKLREKWNNAGHNVVVLHTMSRGNFCPSMVPFAIKLETFLRMMNIKYELDYTMPKGPKNKIPWITLNGEDYTDSELIVQKLQVIFNKFPDAEVPREQRAVGLAMQVMLEEHLYWGLMSWRYCEDELVGLKKIFDLTFIMLLYFKTVPGKMKKTLYLQGLGRHSTEDLHLLMKKDMDALSAYLGEKKFLYGDNPHVADCAVFGMLTQALYNAPDSPYTRWMNEDFPNLRAYTERMRQRFWPDWNKCIKKPGLTL